MTNRLPHLKVLLAGPGAKIKGLKEKYSKKIVQNYFVEHLKLALDDRF